LSWRSFFHQFGVFILEVGVGLAAVAMVRVRMGMGETYARRAIRSPSGH
jgi:hypothetical protein